MPLEISITLIILLIASVFAIWVDHTEKMIPNLSVGLILFSGLYNAYATDQISSALLSAAIAGGFIGFFYIIGKYVTPRLTIYFGDVLLAFVSGIWLTTDLAIPFIIVAAVLGILYANFYKARDQTPEIPFGPALILSLLFFVIGRLLFPGLF